MLDGEFYMFKFIEIVCWLINVSYEVVLVVIVSKIFRDKESVDEDEEGFVTGDNIIYVHPSVDLGMLVVSINISCDKSAIEVSP